MLQSDLVFVLGAGFSAEVGLPLGWRLKHDIVNLLPRSDGGGNDSVRDAILANGNVEPLMRACEHLRRGLPLAASIDNLIEHLAADEHAVRCAKIGIAAAILQSERKSQIFNASTGGLQSPVQDSAFGDLFRLIVGRVSINRMELAFSRVKVINFNYDRCFEHFMINAIMDYSGVRRAQAVEIVKQATILHPYGSLGDPSAKARFGQELEFADLRTVAAGIKTFSEEIGSDENQRIRNLLKGASGVIFLGCAFHDQNLDLLRPDQNRIESIYGTMYLPAPADGGGHAVMTMSDFAKPAIANVARRIGDWPRQRSLVHIPELNFRIEALSNRQLIGRYGASWSE